MSTGIFPTPIAESWRRSAMAGLDPEAAFKRMSYGDVDRESPLLAAARPVLQELNDRLSGAHYSTILVDRDGRVAHHWCGDDGTRKAFDNLGVMVGASLIEEAVGTNALGTVLETRSSITINAAEHFAVPLRDLSCYGHPIFHPTTRRIEGVLDLSAFAETANPLFPPLIARAVADIEQRLLDGTRVSDRHLLAAFQATGSRRRAAVAIGHDLLMSNQAAMDLLGATDMALLRMIATDLGKDTTVSLTLESGAQVQVQATRVPGARGGALMHLEPVERRRHTAAPLPSPASTVPILICGPPGSGRTTRARDVSTSQPMTVLTAASALIDGPQAWARAFAALVRSGQGSVCIDGIDLLPDSLLELVSSHAKDHKAPQLILISGPTENLTGHAAALAGTCADRVELASLSSRITELPQLIIQMLTSLGANNALHFTPGALRALSHHSWPGNLRELRSVVEQVVRRRSVGAVTTEDLPDNYRHAQPSRPMAPIERAERDAIVAALRDHNGNKVRAAESLGISRTTLYAKMRALRINVY